MGMPSDMLAQFTALLPASDSIAISGGISGDISGDMSGDISGEISGYLSEWRDKYHGKTPLILFPRTSSQLQDIVKLANRHKVPLAIQGGNTGLVGGSTPSIQGFEEILVSTRKMRAVIDVDKDNHTITVEAGVTLKDVQEAALKAGLYFPLSLASEGSCTIGGNLATNAGGIHVVKYGNARDLCLGVEAVLPNGTLWEGLKGLRKDNSGYNLSQLLISSEGTLGIITKAVLKLYPKPLQTETIFLSTANPKSAVAILSKLKAFAGDSLSAFELMGRCGLEFVFTHMPFGVDPLSKPYPWYIICDVTATRQQASLQRELEDYVASLMEDGLVLDAVVAQSGQQASQLWALREAMSEAQKKEGGSIKHDISLPISAIPEFITQAIAAVEKLVPGVRPTPFGHLGDGNLHFNFMQPADMDKGKFLDLWPEINSLVHDIVQEYTGSISAEHGIGTMKKDELARTAPAANIAAMQAIKTALDPNLILNRGRIISS